MKTIKLITLSFLFLSFCAFTHSMDFKKFNIWNAKRKKLTIAYNKAHYNYNSALLINPKVIVIHYTAIPTLKATLKAFKPAELPSNRKYIKKFGILNVGVHFVVDKDGTIYRLLPEKYTGRHVIGLNYTSFGIENVAKNSGELTKRQLESDMKLVRYLTSEYSSIHYLIGHFEYTDKRLPHYKLFREKDKDYKPTVKRDPGPAFMKTLRSELDIRYKIHLLK